MAKKRSCRRTEDENKIHEKAVKWRKMTDEQLVHYVEDRIAKAYSEGHNQAVGNKKIAININKIIDEIGSVKGIGITKLKEIEAILHSHLELEGGTER